MKVITTVGISLFTDYMKKDVMDVFQKNEYEYIGEKINDLENKPFNTYNLERFKPKIEYIKKIIIDNWLKGIIKNSDGKWEINKDCKMNKDASSEIKSIFKIQEEVDENLDVYLLVPDTLLAGIAAEIIKNQFDNNVKINVKINNEKTFALKGYQVEKQNDFEEYGLESLFQQIKSILKNNKEKVILNVSGGYKFILPYMTIIAELYNLPIKYIYEDSDEIITISDLPFSFDWGIAEKYYQYLLNIGNCKSKDIIEKLHKMHLIRKTKKGNCLLSSLGNLVKSYIDKNMLTSNRVLGYFVEYKLYEYYIENIYKSKAGVAYKFIQHSVDKIKSNQDWMNKKEFDLILSSEEDTYKNFIVVESKSYYYIYTKDNFKKLSEQIKDQIKVFENGLKPVEYHLCLYNIECDGVCENNVNEWIKESYIQSRFKILKDLFNNINCIFKIYLINIHYGIEDERSDNYKNQNLYQKSINSPINKKNDIKLIYS